MDRRNFFQKSTAIPLFTDGTMVLGNNIIVEPFIIKYLDKLINEKGEYILPPLHYEYNALEPFMDAETLNLQHTFQCMARLY